MNKRGQAAMEFLMTYGWAIVVVLAAIGALAYFGVLSPQKLLPDRTTFTAPLPNVDNAVVLGNNVTIAFKNNKGVDIVLPAIGLATGVTSTGDCINPTITGTYTDAAGAQLTLDNTTRIQNGGGFLLTFYCTGTTAGQTGSKFKTDLTFPYQNYETKQTLSQTGSVEGKYS